MKKHRALKFEGNQDIYVHKQKDGSMVPTITQELYLQDSGEPFFVNEVPLAKVLDSMMSYKTMIGGNMKAEDKEALLAEFDAILEVVQQKKEQAKQLPEWIELQRTTKKKL